MLSFTLDRNGQPLGLVNLHGSYAVGSDGVPLRAELELREGRLVCAKRADGPAGVALVWPVPGCGTVLMETSRLLERDKPYNLPLELVRGRLMRINQKREEWGLYDFEGIEPVAAEIDKARDLFVDALKADSPEQQTKLAQQALQVAFVSGEQLSHFHAELFLQRRKQSRAFHRRLFGCRVDVTNTSEGYRQRLLEGFDFVSLAIPWRAVEPKQQEVNWRTYDAWVEWLTKHRIPIKVGPLVSFHESHVPDWVGMYETDFETVRNLIFDHVRRTVERYSSYVFQWDVVSGIHAQNAFDYSFEQLMELTRVIGLLVKQLAPRAQTIIDLVEPWGEYYARNQRTIPPMLYADMVVQSSIGFDGLGAQFVFGAPVDGMFVRDMFQISDKLDRLGNFGKPLHITALQVPSAANGEGPTAGGGSWWKPWSETVQARWVKEFCSIAFSKPFVESITWRELSDRPGSAVPSGGLLQADLTPKPAYKILREFRSALNATSRKPPVQGQK